VRRPKRIFDFLLAGIGLLMLWPFFLLVAMLVRVNGGGPVFYRQQRVGLRGRLFQILKFRTMTPQSESFGMALTVAGDSRITRIGHSLRRWKLDELPQLINVLRGEMSLVGPRPEVPRYVRLYTPEQRRVLEFTPGITDPASIRYSNEAELLARSGDPERTYIEEVMPDKIRLNLAYAETATIWTDLKVIFATLRQVFPTSLSREHQA
jgi:lipopolysaccharide/colanic/teichoic acid biosynthesis glycosyltransferase